LSQSSSQKKHQTFSSRLHVSTDHRRMVRLDVTICDIKLGWHSETSLCIYRARCCYAVRTIEERYRNRSEYFNHACFRRHAPIPAQLRSLTPTQRTERTDRGIRRHHRGKRRKI